MNDFQRAQTNMFDVVRKLCRTYYAILSAYMPFVAVFDEFESLRDELSEWLAKQADQPKGIAISKMKRRLLLEEDAFVLSNALVAYARLYDQAELENRTNFTPSKLRKAAESELIGYCVQLLQDGEAHLPGLAPFHIDSPWLTAFESKIDTFTAMLGAPSFARSEIRKATGEVNRLTKSISACLRLKLDPLMSHFKTIESRIYLDYRNGRKLIKVASEKPKLSGRVTDSEGNALKDLKVIVQGKHRKSFTTAKGRFLFTRIVDGQYTLVVKDGRKVLATMQVQSPSDQVVIVVDR